MKDVLGVINLVNTDSELGKLTNHRCQASVPFAGRYRMIDFLLSSFVNSTIQNVGIFTSKKYRSLLDHLGQGSDWDLQRKQDGLFIFPYSIKSGIGQMNDLSIFYEHLDFFEKSPQQYVLLTFGSPVANVDFIPMFRAHLKTGADITLVYKEKANMIKKEQEAYTHIEMDESERITKIGRSLDSDYVSLDFLFIDKHLFINIIKTYYQENLSFMDVLSSECREFSIKGYKYQGYYAKISSLKDYFSSMMRLLDPDTIQQLLFEPNEVYTKLKDEPPTKYLETADVKNSLIANGCIVEGHVENSILFRGVHVKPGATIKDSIVMQKCQVGENAHLELSILDKEVMVLQNHKIKGCLKEPYVVEKKATI